MEPPSAPPLWQAQTAGGGQGAVAGEEVRVQDAEVAGLLGICDSVRAQVRFHGLLLLVQ